MFYTDWIVSVRDVEISLYCLYYVKQKNDWFVSKCFYLYNYNIWPNY